MPVYFTLHEGTARLGQTPASAGAPARGPALPLSEASPGLRPLLCEALGQGWIAPDPVVLGGADYVRACGVGLYLETLRDGGPYHHLALCGALATIGRDVEARAWLETLGPGLWKTLSYVAGVAAASMMREASAAPPPRRSLMGSALVLASLRLDFDLFCYGVDLLTASPGTFDGLAGELDAMLEHTIGPWAERYALRDPSGTEPLILSQERAACWAKARGRTGWHIEFLSAARRSELA